MLKLRKLQRRSEVRIICVVDLQDTIHLLQAGATDRLSATDKGHDASLNNVEISPVPYPPQASAHIGLPSQNMPKEWALPWSNALLRERIDEREREPGCGGGLARRRYHQFFGFALAHLYA